MIIISIRKWQQFEANVFNTLKKFETPFLQFQEGGSCDSTIPDIKVYKNNCFSQSLECKFSKSQGAQFVVLWENKNFKYSPLNRNPETLETKKIITLMNNSKEYFSKIFDPSENDSVVFDIDEETSAKHFINYYSLKKTSYIISSNYLDRDFKIIPLKKIGQNFTLNAVYRIKRSGSRILPRCDYNIAKTKFKEKYNQDISDLNNIIFMKDLTREECYFGDNKEYFLSLNENNSYRVRKLSNTYNANVIFTLSLKENTLDSISIENLIKNLKNE